ncbi:MAG TPA: sporulation protein YqfD [Symbiobacteriaceae bacterium]|nr:sporulation protein YqfD [Symbiobacteriaceae bacterium]
MFRRLVTWILGTLRLEVVGGDHGLLLGRAVAAGLTLWGMQRRGARLMATLTLSDFYRLPKLRRGTGCRIRIRGRQGLPFFLRDLRRRPAWVAGLAFVAGMLIWAAGHVWRVEVRITGPENLDRRAVLQVAADAGLAAGVWRTDFDPQRVATEIKGRIPEASWVVVRLTGTRAVIEVVEKAAQQAPQAAACINLYAKKDAVVEKVIPFQGESVVRPGQIVKKGDLLVECVLRYYAGGRPPVYPGTPMPPRTDIAHTVPVEARVKGRVHYEEYREVSLVQNVPVRTGESVQSWVLNWRGQPILELGAEGVPFEQAEEEARRLSLPVWRNWTPPVELVIRTTYEVNRRLEPLDLSDVVKEVESEFRARLNWLLGPTDQLATPLKVEVVEKGKDWAGVKVTVETLEEIGLPQEGAPPTTPPAQPRP